MTDIRLTNRFASKKKEARMIRSFEVIQINNRDKRSLLSFKKKKTTPTWIEKSTNTNFSLSSLLVLSFLEINKQKMKNETIDIIIILTRFLLIIIPDFESDTIHHSVKFRLLIFFVPSKTTNRRE